MIPARPTEDELTDYIDGRLDEERRVEVEAWLREHPVTAREVERQRQLNEALRALGSEVLDEPVPDRLRDVLEGRLKLHAAPEWSENVRDENAEAGEARQRTRGHKGRWSRRSRLLESAAAALIFVTGLVVGWVAHAAFKEAPSELDLLLADASYAYLFYRDGQDDAIQFPPDRLGDFEAMSARLFDHRVNPPDLSPAGYQFRGARIAPMGRRASTFFFFEGSDGSDLAVLFWPHDAPGPADRSAATFDQVASRIWFVDDLGFAVMGSQDSSEILDDIAGQLMSFYNDLS